MDWKIMRKQHNVTIDFLRFLFSVIVVLHHSRYVLGDDNCYFLGGSLAVEFFFFVSGYLLLVGADKAGRKNGAGYLLPGGADKAGRKNGAGYLFSGGVDMAGRTEAAGLETKGIGAGTTGIGGKTTGIGGEANGIGSETTGICWEMTGIGSETLHFILHKIRSFLPEFLIAWWIGFVLIGVVRQYGVLDYLKAFGNDFWELTLVKMSGLFTHGIDGAMWYLSAMLLGMAILYPLLRTKRDLMTHLVCPLLALFLYGYLCQAEGHPRDPIVWLGLCYKGLVRAVAGLCTGVVICMAVRRLKRFSPSGLTKTGNALAIGAQLLCLLLTIRYMAEQEPSEYDYFYMFLLMLLVLLSFAGFGLESVLGNSQRLHLLSAFLGKYSLSLYLGHLYFAQHVNELLPEELYSGKIRMTVYLAAAFANGLLVMGLSALYRRYSRGGKSSGTKPSRSISGTKTSGTIFRTIYQLLVKAEK